MSELPLEEVVDAMVDGRQASPKMAAGQEWRGMAAATENDYWTVPKRPGDEVRLTPEMSVCGCHGRSEAI